MIFRDERNNKMEAKKSENKNSKKPIESEFHCYMC